MKSDRGGYENDPSYDAARAEQGGLVIQTEHDEVWVSGLPTLDHSGSIKYFERAVAARKARESTLDPIGMKGEAIDDKKAK